MRWFPAGYPSVRTLGTTHSAGAGWRLRSLFGRREMRNGFPEFEGGVQGVDVTSEAEPKVIPYNDPENPQFTSLIFDADFFSGTLRNMMKDAKNNSMLPLIIHRAAVEDNWQGFVTFIRGGGGPEWWGDQIMERVIRCSEKWAAFDPAAIDKNSFMAVRDIPLAQNQAISCKYTPVGVTPEERSLQPASQVPVLIFNGSLDPIDPPENMADASDLWPNSQAFTLPYQAHQQSDITAINCFFSIMNDFIQTGSAKGLDGNCLQNIRPPNFVVP